MNSTTANRLGAVLLAVSVATVAAGGCTESFDEGALYLAYMPDGKVFAALPRQARVYDTGASRRLRTISTESWPAHIPQAAGTALAADGQTFAAVTNTGVSVYRTDTGALVTSLDLQPGGGSVPAVAGVALSPDGSLLAASVRSFVAPATVSLWRVADASLVAELQPAAGRLAEAWSSAMVFSHDGTLLVGSDWVNADGAYLYAWRTDDGAMDWSVPVPNPENPRAWSVISAMAVSADGTMLVTASNTLRLWTLATGVLDATFEARTEPAQFATLSFSADGQRVVGSHFTSLLSDPIVFGRDGSVVRTWPIVDSGCSASAYSPDGTQIAGACGDLLKVWDAETGELVRSVGATVRVPKT